MQTTFEFGTIVKHWRSRRRMSQLDLALEADISSRHLSFIETGRSKPTRSMVLRIAEHLDMPLRERNGMLLAAGYAPEYRDEAGRDPQSAEVLDMLREMVERMAPMPALIIDGGWDLVAANAMAGLLMAGIAGHLLAPPVNVLRLSLHPEGLAPKIRNLAVWRGHLMDRLDRQLQQTDDGRLRNIAEEIRAYPGSVSLHDEESRGPAVRLELTIDGQELAFLSATMVVGGPRDVVISELAVEMFMPADPPTRAWLAARHEIQRG
jgi:transcriptional regulator with XRE-family HTH domain